MVIVLENEVWQAGILPQTGASIAFGRIRRGDAWVDVMRPTPESDYGNSSKCSSFIMLPWANRIRDAKLQFQGETYSLKAAPDDGTARHGDVRNRAWQVVESSQTGVKMAFDSRQHEGVNFPFAFTAEAEYRLEGRDFVWVLSLTNVDSRRFPAGFGHHPYFVRDASSEPQVEIPCDAYFELENFVAVRAAVPVTPRVDFRQLRALDAAELNDLLTERQGDRPARMVYPFAEITLHSDPVFAHTLIYAPEGKPFYAVEPQTNANDGFNLYEQGIAGSGVFVVQPGETVTGSCRLSVKS